MNKQTFQQRLKAANATGTARQLVIELVTTKVPGATIYPCHTSGVGRYCKNVDNTGAVTRILTACGIGHASGNSSPRGGKTGQWVSLNLSGWRACKPLREAAAIAQAEQAKADAEQALKDQAAWDERLAACGNDADIFRAWWNSGVMHPAPLEVMQAKERSGLTWGEVKQIAKGC